MRRRTTLILCVAALIAAALWSLSDQAAHGPREGRGEEREGHADSPTLSGRAEPSPDPGLLAREAPGRTSPIESGLFPPPNAEEIAALLADIRTPRDAANFDSMPPFGDNTLLEMAILFHRAYRSVVGLAEAGASDDLDETLLAMARSSAPWDSRCRATHTLVLRGAPGATELLQGLIVDRRAHVRFVAWDICPGAISAAVALERHAEETDPEVLERIEYYLGRIRAKAAAPIFLQRLRKAPGVAHHTAAHCLGLLRAEEAVPLLIESLGVVSRNERTYRVALGRIGSAAAVEFLLKDIEADGAVEALGESGDKSALPALERALERAHLLPKSDRNARREFRLHLAVLRLRGDDPCPALMEAIEDTGNHERLRRTAMYELRSCMGNGALGYEERLARIYRDEPSTAVAVRHGFLRLLEDSRARGVTDAMLHHALTWTPHGNTTSPRHVIGQLNRRLGTSFETVADVERYVATKKNR